MKVAWDLFKSFFLNYLWLGVVVLLISIILDFEYPPSERNSYLSVSIKLLEGVGISIMIAAIFTYASGTSQFIGKIRELLQDIVVRRDFLSNIDADSKKEALMSIIKPSNTESNKYPNIGDYYGYFIDKTLSIKEKSVRSNYSINARAYLCSKKKSIAVEGIYTYRLYPSVDGFNDIVLGFEDSLSYCSSVVVSDPDGERMVFEGTDVQTKEYEEGGDKSFRANLCISEFAAGKNHVDVELKLTEYGNDHWKMIQFKALQPTDGFRFQLHCEGGIRLQEHAVFVVGAKYRLDIGDDRKSVSFSCNQWVNEGTGLSFLVSIPCQADEEKNVVVTSVNDPGGSSTEGLDSLNSAA